MNRLRLGAALSLSFALLVAPGCKQDGEGTQDPGVGGGAGVGGGTQGGTTQGGGTQGGTTEGGVAGSGDPSGGTDLDVNKDRDPEEEKRKMAESRKFSDKAIKHLKAGNLDAAVEESRAALMVHEQNVDAMLVVAEVFYKQGKFELVDSVVSSALQVDERRLSDEQISRAYNLRAFAYMADGKRVPAMQAMRKAAETDAKNATAWNNLGVQYMFQGDFPTATSCFVYALELDPTFLKAKFNLGASLRAEGKLEEAEKTFREVMEKKGSYPEAHFNLGVLYLDAETFPGLDTSQRLNKSIGEFEAYKKAIGAVTDGDGGGETGEQMALDRFDKIPGKELVSGEQADLYIGVAKKKLDREKKRLEREKKRQEEEAEKANGGGEDDAEDEPAAEEPDGERP